MNIFNKLKAKREEYKAKRLRYAEMHAQKLEAKANYESNLASQVDRQQSAKQRIKNAKRRQHPVLYKVGTQIKERLKQNKASGRKPISLKANTTFSSSNVFQSTQNQTPYWLKAKSKKPYWLK